ncbi:FtsX-like permease family protein [Fictibacillus sp. Mic-4]|uniref:ABC transporter permease n=1 Tax=Fictibacillus TaxID=1329200 RepID=UPI0004162933|nr:FtsX-like permease family protein [Fictibacillus gelatini]
MRFKDKYRFVRANMKKNKMRIFMTVLAATIGCSFLIVLASVGFGLHQYIANDIMSRKLVNQIEVHSEKGPLTEKDVKKLETLKGIKAVTTKNYSEASKISFRNYEGDLPVVSVNMEQEKKAGFELSEGRLPKSENEIVVGYSSSQAFIKKGVNKEDSGLTEKEVKEKLEENRYRGKLLGKTVQLEVQKRDGKKVKKIPLTIVGIGKKPKKAWIDDRSVYISETVLHTINRYIGERQQEKKQEGSTRTYDEVNVYTKSMDDVKTFTEKINDLGYQTYSVYSELKEVNLIFMIIKVGLIFVGTIAVLIASIGIFNTMTMAVTERAQDIGIMKAIGAHPQTIKRIFLMESSFIGLLGALLGTLIAYIISFAVNLILPIVIKQFTGENVPGDLSFSYIPLSLTLIATVICIVVTLISGWRPARKATQVDVLQALRRDV